MPMLSIAQTTITNNVAQAGNDPTTPFGFAEGQGGGIFSSSNLTISASTLSSNEAIGPGSELAGGRRVWAGGGLYNDEGIATISNTTIAANSGVGGAGTIALSSGAGGAGGGARGWRFQCRRYGDPQQFVTRR